MYLREELEAARAVLLSRKEEALAAAAAELSKAAVVNMLLAGSLAHEFLAHGTVLGGAADRRSAELSCLLAANGAHLPGIVNPTQLLLATGSGVAVDDQTIAAADPEEDSIQQPPSTGDERYEAYKSLLACTGKMDEGSSSVSRRMLRLSGCMQRLEALGCPVSQELGAGLVLASLIPPPPPPPGGDSDSSQATSEVYEIYKTLFDCKMAEGGSVDDHVLRLSGYMQRLDTLKCPVSQELGTELVLASLPPSYSSFVINYYNVSGKVGKSVGELFAMLKTTADQSGVQKEVDHGMMLNKNTGFKKKTKFSAESGVQKERNRAMPVNKTTDFKKKNAKSKKKGKSKGASGAGTPTKSQVGPHPDAECFFCKEKGHWKRNCKKYLAEKKKSGNSISGTIET